MQILASLDGIGTDVRQLVRDEPLEAEEVNLVEYKHLGPRWYDWQAVKAVRTECHAVL